MEARDYAVYKHIIVAIGEEVTVRPTDFATRLNRLDDPHRGSDHRVRLNFNEAALLIDHRGSTFSKTIPA